MKIRIAVLLLLAGLLLIGSGGVQYVLALERQRAEQAERDAHWSKVQQEAARRFPRALPGEARPDPAPLERMPIVLGLLGVGLLLSIGGLVGLFLGPPPSDSGSEAGEDKHD